jgi:glycosyltransferase involved in cell wall biosynthesis
MTVFTQNEYLRQPLGESGVSQARVPQFSVIMGIFNDWKILPACLQSMVEQIGAPSFEVILVDDGGSLPTEPLDRWAAHFPLKYVRQDHAGLGAARNCGIRIARGELLVFVDADCRLDPGCFAALAKAVASAPQQNSFQLHLIGDPSRLVGRAEGLRLATVQDQLLQPNGCIRYIETSGAAIRRRRADPERGLFDARAMRAEDTILLSELMQEGELPLFVPGAIVQHAVSLSLRQYMLKAVRVAYLERQPFEFMDSKGIKVRVSHRKRLSMLLAMWRLSAQSSTGRLAWFVTAARQTLGRTVFYGNVYLYRLRTLLRPA